MKRWLDVNFPTVFYKKGDVVGICIDFGKDEIFVTKNGQRTGNDYTIKRINLKDRKRNNIPNVPWFATFSTSVPSHVKLNFGASPFVFPLKEYINKRDTMREDCVYEVEEENEEEEYDEEDLFEPYSDETDESDIFIE